MRNREQTPQPGFESTDLNLIRQLDRDDHLTNHDAAVLQKLQEYKESMGDFAGFSPEVKLATIQCLLDMDKKYGFKEVCTSLQELVPMVAEHAFQYHPKDETEQGAALYKIRLLQFLYNQLDWIRVHGCSAGGDQ